MQDKDKPTQATKEVILHLKKSFKIMNYNSQPEKHIKR